LVSFLSLLLPLLQKPARIKVIKGIKCGCGVYRREYCTTDDVYEQLMWKVIRIKALAEFEKINKLLIFSSSPEIPQSWTQR